MMRRASLIGLAFGAGAVHIAAVGVLLAMHQRWIIIDVLSITDWFASAQNMTVPAAGPGAWCVFVVVGLAAECDL